MKYCGQCGAELKDDAKFCANCGEKCPNSTIKTRAESTKTNSEKKPQRSPMIGITAVLVIIAIGVFVMCWSKGIKQQLVHTAGSDNHVIAPDNEKLTHAELIVGTWISVDNDSCHIIFSEDGTVRFIYDIHDDNSEGMFSRSGSIRYELDGDKLIIVSPEEESSVKYELDQNDLTIISDEEFVKFRRAEESAVEIQDPTHVRDTSETPTEQEIQTIEDKNIGNYTIDDIKSNGYGFYIMYEDGSFDRYYSGNVLIWEGPRPMTYGADYIPQDFIIDIDRDKVNRERISAGKLVLVCNEINRVEYSLTPVEFSGNAMSCTVENDEVVLFLSQNSVQQWSSGHSIGWVIADTIKVNGVFLNEWSANMESSNRREYLPLTENDEFQISVTRGAKMETVDCVVDKRYYFQDLETEFDLKLEPTTDGYAIVDLSDIPVGEYLIHYSYWNSERDARSVLATHVVVE